MARTSVSAVNQMPTARVSDFRIIILVANSDWRRGSAERIAVHCVRAGKAQTLWHLIVQGCGPDADVGGIGRLRHS